ncbi:hypothetical protein [Peribacillus frigoritolerans]|uniref:hypothetical protein n=1 Tax=Peribacillus frigoritolerans TaxID=450367 RepID=UPI0032E446C0
MFTRDFEDFTRDFEDFTREFRDFTQELECLLVNLCVSLKFAAFTPAFLSLFWRNSNTSCLYIIFL